MDTNKPFDAANPWHPITSSIDLKHLGKLSEELGECIASVSRCIIQGMEEKEPHIGKINREWLEEEIADVIANIELNIEHFKLNISGIQTRVSRKKLHLRGWHEQA